MMSTNLGFVYRAVFAIWTWFTQLLQILVTHFVSCEIIVLEVGIHKVVKSFRISIGYISVPESLLKLN